MRKALIAILAALGVAHAWGVEVGGEVAPDGLRPYVVLSRAYPLGEGLYLVPSFFVYPMDLTASLRRGWFSLQLLGETPWATWGLEGYLRGTREVALRFFVRLGQ